MTNKIRIRVQHISYQFLGFGGYVILTFVAQQLLSKPVYETTLNYYCEADGVSCWSSLGKYLTWMICLQVGFYLLFWLMHYAKWALLGTKKVEATLLPKDF
jgi:hypothetical protein